jgi:flagellar biosynthetic protein FliR
MLDFDLTKLEPLIAGYFFPFVRIGACLMVAPVFGAGFVPARLRLMLAGALSLLVAPLLPQQSLPALLSLGTLTLTAQELIIGAAIGFSLQLVFDALALGGQLLANGMGLGVAFNIDPLRGVSTPALGQFYVVLGTLIFLALDGHTALLQMTVDSFRGLPVGGPGLGPDALRALADWGSIMFSGALGIALPGVTALLVVNLAFGVISRTAPALNLFAVGLPVTLAIGTAVVLYGLPMVQSGFTRMLGVAMLFLQGLTGGQGVAAGG